VNGDASLAAGHNSLSRAAFPFVLVKSLPGPASYGTANNGEVPGHTAMTLDHGPLSGTNRRCEFAGRHIGPATLAMNGKQPGTSHRHGSVRRQYLHAINLSALPTAALRMPDASPADSPTADVPC